MFLSLTGMTGSANLSWPGQDLPQGFNLLRWLQVGFVAVGEQVFCLTSDWLVYDPDRVTVPEGPVLR